MSAADTSPFWSSADFESFLSHNELGSPLELPQLDSEAVEELKWPQGNGEEHVAAARTYRRLHRLSEDVEVSERLQEQGLLSASQIASIPLGEFVRSHSGPLAVSKEEATAIHRRAVRVQNRVLHMLAAVGGIVQPYFRSSRINNVAPETVQHFEELPSYQEIFGSLDYCACEQCKSIFGPAAYLVDLLRIVDERITKPNEATIQVPLAARRPDIEQIPLTCSMTNDLVPYLQIVDERLLETVASLRGIEPSEVLPALAKAEYPSILPANVPLGRVRTLLRRSRLTLGQIFAAWGANPADTAYEQLGLSPERAAIVLTAATEPAAIACFYGTTAAGLGELEQLDAFVKATSLTVPAVENLIVQRLSPAEIGAGVAENLFVNQGAGTAVLTLKTETSGETTIENLTPGALDRLNRLRRLADDCGWDPREVDWALRSVSGDGTPAIDTAALEDLQRIRAFAERFELTPVQAAALVGPIKTYGEDAGAGASLFDQLFNPPALTAETAPYHPAGNPLNPLYTTTPLQWTGAASSSAALNRVLPGLGLSLDGATTLATALLGDGKKAVPLGVAALSTLYRHALAARCLNLPVDQYLELLDLLGLSGRTVFKTTDLELLASRGDWMAAEELSAPLLTYTTEGRQSPFVDPLLDPAKVALWLPSVVQAVPIDAPDAAGRLDAQIATFLGAPADLTTAARTMAIAAEPPPTELGWEQAFLASFDPPEKPPHLEYVEKVLRLVARWLAFATAASVPAEVMSCAARNPEAFGLNADFTPIALDALRDIAGLASFVERYEDRRGHFVAYVELSTKAPPDPEAVAALAAATGWDKGQIAALLEEELKGVKPAVERLRRLEACFAQARALGADVGFLRGLAGLAGLAAESSEYATQAERLLAKLSASLGPAAWAAAGGEIQGEIATRERDPLLALAEAELRAKYPDLDTPEDVWEYLLTDVQTGPEAQISYVKEALNAVQLYLQRCRLGIEAGVEKVEIPESWWTWILDYRRWEANRRIFVYPENYLLPSVRGDRTKLFRDLEDTLQQSEVTPGYVEDAYVAYLQELLSVSQLTPVDSFAGTVWDERKGGSAEGFYLFGRTTTEPAKFYVCRRLKGSPWSEWEEIGVTIPAAAITPAYAFNKLFVFWVQVKRLDSPSIKQVPSGEVATTYNTSWRATIQYSFQDTRGRWSEPQTLAQDELVDFVGQGQDEVPLAEKPLFAGPYDTELPAWHRVLALGIGSKNLTAVTSDAEAERLVVIHGGPLNPVPETLEVETGKEPTNPDGAVFTDDLRARTIAHNQLIAARSPGNQGAGRAYVLNAWLEDDVLASQHETVLLDPYWAKAPTEQYFADINSFTGEMQLVPSAEALTDQHTGGTERRVDLPAEAQFIDPSNFTAQGIPSPVAGEIFKALESAGAINSEGVVQRAALAELDLYVTLEGKLPPLQLMSILDVLLRNSGAPVLFSAIDPKRGRTAAVKGMPASFLLDNGDEAFLLSPEPSASLYSSLQEGLEVSLPPLNPKSFTMPAASPPVSSHSSETIFALLREYAFVDAAGRLNAPWMRNKSKSEELLNLLVERKLIVESQQAMVKRIALNHPIASDKAFVGGRIDSQLSRQIYEQLRRYSLIDANGRVNLELLSISLVSLVLAGISLQAPFTFDEVRMVYRRLTEIPTGLALSYRNLRNPGNTLEKGKFHVTRLTTAAVPRLERILASKGIDGLLDLRTQNIPVVPIVPFDRLGPVADRIEYPEAIDAAQVDFEGLYGRYFWELFFHGPILVANSLAASQRYREALAWFQKVFDPTAKERLVTAELIAAETAGRISEETAAKVVAQLESPSHGIGTPPKPILQEGRVNTAFTATSDLSFLAEEPGLDEPEIAMTRNILLNEELATPAGRFWRFRPFRHHTLATLKQALTDSEAIQRYDDDPFDPFAIAALRIGAFEKATVMQYVDTLLAWGDQCFAEDTWESVTAASMLYLYASDLLGTRPQQVGICPQGPPKTFAEIRDHYKGQPGGIPQFLLYLEDSLPRVADEGAEPVAIQEHGFNDLGAYFCVPENPVLTGYWDRIEDRLHKIEHSLDIQGRPRALALFEPPLDPLALARAAAASNDLAPPSGGARREVPPVRFSVALQRARSLAATVAALGSQILAAMERGDAEALSLLQTTQQAQVLALSGEIRQDQIEAAEASIKSLQATLAAAGERASFYSGLIEAGQIGSEKTNLEAMGIALTANVYASYLNAAASIGYAVPQAGSPFAMTYGGIQLGSIVQAAGAAAQIGAEIANYIGQRALTMAGYERREQEWKHQLAQAQRDVEGAGAQLEAAEAQVAVAKRELAINERELAQNQQLEGLLRSKFTNRQLYQWMAGRLSALHYQTYLLALEAARDAEKAFQFEQHRGETFLDTDVWDGARKGLLAGEALTLALDRMEAAAQEPLHRSLEIERTISLGQLNPLALDALKRTGCCVFDLPELLFDYDYPGHYARQIKSISISIPAVVGPYENIKATLTQEFNGVALKADKEAAEWLMQQTGDPPAGVRRDWGVRQQVALSRGVDDSGQFVLDFGDPRYLPFEGTGAVSRWRLEMAPEANRLDFDQLSDVIVTVHYTARSDGALAEEIRHLLANKPLSVGYYVDARRNHPVEWEALMRDHSDPATQTLRFDFAPQWAGALKSLELKEVVLRLNGKLEWPQAATPIGTLKIGSKAPLPLSVADGIATVENLKLSRGDFSGGWEVAFDLSAIKANSELKPLLDEGWLNPNVLTDLEVIDLCKASVY